MAFRSRVSIRIICLVQTARALHPPLQIQRHLSSMYAFSILGDTEDANRPRKKILRAKFIRTTVRLSCKLCPVKFSSCHDYQPLGLQECAVPKIRMKSKKLKKVYEIVQKKEWKEAVLTKYDNNMNKHR